MKTCWNCNGTGHIECNECDGAGSRMQYVIEQETFDYSSFDKGFRYRTCPDCSGRGKDDCDICDGTGELYN